MSMSEQMSLGPDTRRQRGSDGVVVPINETIPPQSARPAPAESPDDEIADAGHASFDVLAAATAQSQVVPPAREHRRGGRLFSAFCALLALIAAAIALAAPTLRPEIAAAANAWFGKGNPVSRLIAPPAEFDAGWRQAREEAMVAMNAHLTDFTARFDRLDAAQQATADDVARAVADMRANRAASDTLVRAVDDLSRQTQALHATAAAIDGRVRAAGLLTLSLRLRRDVDAGLPIGRDVSALAAAGPYPAAIERALQQLRRINDSAPTMRDLADEFDRVMAQLTARNAAGASWASRGWSRMAAVFGGGAPAGDTGVVEHLRALAMDGRFTEAADEIAASGDADLGAAWVARVRIRATAVVATQALLTYSLAAYENAFAASGSDAGGRLTQ
jgi:hypothetical protein